MISVGDGGGYRWVTRVQGYKASILRYLKKNVKLTHDKAATKAYKEAIAILQKAGWYE
jgi:hypothetical protein